MSIFDGKRLSSELFKLDISGLRQGWYTDKYFWNIAVVLEVLAKKGYRFRGTDPRQLPHRLNPTEIEVGNLEVEMQLFTRRKPFSIAAGTDLAIAILRECAGYFNDQGQFIQTFPELEVQALQDGSLAPYNGDPMDICPVMKIRGRYRDFAILETPLLGVLARATRMATNTYELLKAAKGKTILQFGARFENHEMQALDGYAYFIGVQRYNYDYEQQVEPFISTDAQGEWWGGIGGGTISHSYIACFLSDVGEAIVAFAEHMPIEVKRVALVDFNNDCIGESLLALRRMFERYISLKQAGRKEEAEKFVLFGVRPDTDSHLRDISIAPIGEPRLDCGVNPRLIWQLRKALDEAYQTWNLPADQVEEAKLYCRNVKIIATGGFNPEKIELFERLQAPVDIYGVGSYLLSSCSPCGTNNDFTADVVRIKVEDRWLDMAKVGRKSCENPDLQLVS